MTPSTSSRPQDELAERTERTAANRSGPGSPGPQRIASWRRRLIVAAPRSTSTIAALLGLLALVDVVLPHRWRVVSAFDPLFFSPPRVTVEVIEAVCALWLLRIAAGLRRRKRAEWRIAVAACCGIAIVDLVRDDNRPVEATLAVSLLGLLLLARREFTARADPHSRWVALRVGGLLTAAALGYGLLLVNLPGHVVGHPTAGARLREVVFSLAGVGASIRLTNDNYADAFHAGLLAMGLLTVTATALLLLRTVEPRPQLSAEDEQRLRSLLDRHGARDSVGYFALRRDKCVVWSASGKAAITYRVVAGVALISGDPLGDPEAWPGAIDAYRQLVADYGWTPAVMGCSELGAIVIRRELGLCVLALGDEAILSTETFCLDGRAMRGVRQPCGRVRRAGYEITLRRVRDVPETELAELRAAAAAWRGDEVERGYSMALSRLGDPADGDCVVAVARQHATLRGLLHFVPWSARNLSLDLMRRDPAADNGLNEYLIAMVMEQAPALGIERVSLNFAVFRDALERGAKVGAGPISRVWRRILLVASRWWQIDSLYRFNSKFQPEWQPRYICYPAARDIPRIAFASLRAESFIVPPAFLLRRG